MSNDEYIEMLEGMLGETNKTIEKFSIAGPRVSGNIHAGYIVSAHITDQIGEGTGSGGPLPAPATCPDPITLLLSGVNVDCGCVPDNVDNIGVRVISSDINGSVSLSPDIGYCGGFGFCICYYFNTVEAGHASHTFYLNTDCTNEFNSGSNQLTYRIIHAGAVWYVVAFYPVSTIGYPLLFYAEVSSLAGTISNQISCSSSIFDFPLNNDFTTMEFGGPVNFSRLGHGGSATVTFP